jgi:molecular chaperone GrpE
MILRTVIAICRLFNLYDRLHIGVEVLQNYRPVNALFKHSRQKDVRFIERFRQGQEMTTRRFEQLLQRYQVSTVNCIDQLLDPETMTAVATGENPKLANGMVLEELRTGFLYQGQVLRLAEVKVNKIKHG